MSHDLEREALTRYLEDHHLKHTKQREAILEAFLETTGHVTSEDLYQRIRGKHPNIGFTTVYRTMKLLSECGLAEARNFGDGQTRYEAAVGRHHHDHLICTQCGAIIEFENNRIEALQEMVARRHGFRVISHKMELYGLCRDCQRLASAGIPAPRV